MGGLVVREWRRHGQDRLYITDSVTGQKVGFYDRKTGKVSLPDASRGLEALTALRPFLASGAPPLANGLRADPPAQEDLTVNTAGAAAAERAAELAPQGFQRLAARVLRLQTEATSREVGAAAGERLVGKRLTKLPRERWTRRSWKCPSRPRGHTIGGRRLLLPPHPLDRAAQQQRDRPIPAPGTRPPMGERDAQMKTHKAGRVAPVRPFSLPDLLKRLPQEPMLDVQPR